MPVHDWTRVDAGTFHDFHNSWIIHLKEAFNGGLLPAGYYALSEQWASRFVADVLTLQAPLAPLPRPFGADGGVAVAETPPHAGRKITLSAGAHGTWRRLVVRHTSGHRIIAMVEIVSPANKDRAAHVEEFADKAELAIAHGIHLLLVDLLPPGPHDRQGMHGAIWERFEPEPYKLPADQPLTLASYVADVRPVVYVEHLAFGSPLAEMPLFLDPDRYINVPLEPTYLAAYRGMPAFWRDVLEGRQPPPS